MFWQKKPTPTPTPLQPTTPAPAGVPSGVPANPLINVNPADYFAKYGYPIPVQDLSAHSEFVSLYDRTKRNPIWVIEHLTAATSKMKEGDRIKSIFQEDNTIPEMFRARLKDYFRSGYDRGHQAPAADARFSQTAMNETFLLTNIAPQVGRGFNRDYWAHFERFCRNLTNRYSSVRIMTGPLYLPKKDVDGKMRVSYEVIGNPPNIAVPTHFFKLVVAEDPTLPSIPTRGVAVAAFVLPNAPISNDTPLKSFEVPVNAIEFAIGSELLPKLPLAQRRQLCQETKCAVEIIEYNEAVKSLTAPGPVPSLTAPRN